MKSFKEIFTNENGKKVTAKVSNSKKEVLLFLKDKDSTMEDHISHKEAEIIRKLLIKALS